MLGRGGGQVVSMLAFYSDDPSLNLAVVYSFSVKIVFEKNKNKQKEAGVGPFKKIKITFGKFPKLRNTNSNSYFYYLAIQSWSVWLRNTYAW